MGSRIMKESWKRAGMGFLLVGAFLILLGAGLYLKNSLEDEQAKKTSADAMESIRRQIAENAQARTQKAGPNGAKAESSMDGAYAETPNYPLDVNTITVDGTKYLCVLFVPEVDLQVPVSDELTEEILKKVPCRYHGTLDQNGFVIAGHNYKSGFGLLKKVKKGAQVLIVDAQGYVHEYVVEEIEILQPEAVEEMISGDWALSLYTCTYGGGQRYTVRCNKVNND